MMAVSFVTTESPQYEPKRWSCCSGLNMVVAGYISVCPDASAKPPGQNFSMSSTSSVRAMGAMT
jgi:hypothetical protein